MLVEGEQKHLLLLSEATDLLKKLEYISTEELAALLERRQALVEWINDFNDTTAGIEASDPVERGLLERFRIFQEETIKKILEVDALVVGLAQERQSSIKAELLAMTKSRTLRDKFSDTDLKPPKNKLEAVF